MADTKITVGIELEDDLTPKIQSLKKDLESISASGGLAPGMREAGKETSFLIEQLKGLKSGIGYTIGAWNVGFMVAEKAVDVVIEAVQQLATVAGAGGDLQRSFALTDQQVSGSLDHIGTAAFAAGSSFADIYNRAQKLYSSGFGQTFDQAIEGAKFAQEEFRATGVDISNLQKKAEVYGITTEDIYKLAAREPLYAPVREKAKDLEELQARKPLIDMERQMRQAAEDISLQQTIKGVRRRFEDEKIQYSQMMEDRNRQEQRSMEDTHRAISQEMEDRHRGIEREFEDRRRMVSQEMEDRHRMAQESAADQDRLLARQTGVASGIKGVMEAALGLPVGKDMASRIGAGVTQAVEAVRAQMEVGMRQLQKDLGIEPGTAKALIQAGAMSPSVLLQEAQAAREEQRIQEQRGMAQEERKTQRAFDAEERQMTRDFQDEEISTNRAMQKEQLEMSRAEQDEELSASRIIAAAELQMSRDNEDKIQSLQFEHEKQRLQAEYNYVTKKYQLEAEAIEKLAEIEAKRRGEEVRGRPLTPEEQAAAAQAYSVTGGAFMGGVGATPEGEALQKSLDDLKNSYDQGQESLNQIYKPNTNSTDRNTESTNNAVKALNDLRTGFHAYKQEMQQTVAVAQGGRPTAAVASIAANWGPEMRRLMSGGSVSRGLGSAGDLDYLEMQARFASHVNQVIERALPYEQAKAMIMRGELPYGMSPKDILKFGGPGGLYGPENRGQQTPLATEQTSQKLVELLSRLLSGG